MKPAVVVDAGVARLVDRVAAAIEGVAPPALVGIGGAVAVGKTTLAGQVMRAFEERGCSVASLTTDSFLLSNAELDARGLGLRKGFPETFDLHGLAAALTGLKAGGEVSVPVYSHETYDVVPGEHVAVAPAGVVVVEGVVALQPPGVDVLDVAVYLDAAEDAVLAWYVDRFAGLCREADAAPGSFYAAFAGMEAPEVRALARRTWEAINAPNVRDHILPSRDRATLVARKDADHRITDVV